MATVTASTKQPLTPLIPPIPLTLDELRNEYTLVFKKVHRIQIARQQAEVDRLQWANRYREWMQGQKEPETVEQRLKSVKIFETHDPYPEMPEPDLPAEQRMAELHHLIAKLQRESSL